jgi:hypothetical protein
MDWANVLSSGDWAEILNGVTRLRDPLVVKSAIAKAARERHTPK